MCFTRYGLQLWGVGTEGAHHQALLTQVPVLLKHWTMKKKMMTSVVSSFFPNKKVIRGGGKPVKDSLSRVWNFPVQVPAATLPGVPAWSKNFHILI